MADSLQKERVETSSRRQDLLAGFGRRALTGTDLRLLMRQSVELARAELNVEHCDLLEVTPAGTALLRAACGHRALEIDQTLVVLHDGSPSALVLRTEAPLVINDLLHDQRFRPPSLLYDYGVVSSVNVPLYGHTRPYGVLGAHCV